MRQLRCWVTPKEANTRSTWSYTFRKLGSGVCFIRYRMLFIVPVLTEQAVKCAGLIKHSQIQKALFRPRSVCPLWVSSATTPCTYPVSYTVGWQWVIIPRDRSGLGTTAHQSPIFILTHAAIATSTNRDFTFVLTESTLNTIWQGWRQSSKAKLFAILSVNFLKLSQTLVVSFANALGTKRQHFGYFLGDLAAFFTRGHNIPASLANLWYLLRAFFSLLPV